MIDNTALSERVIESPGEKQLFIAALKRMSGKTFIDVRKWHDNPWGKGKFPGKGIMLRVEQWPEVIKAIQAMLDESQEYAKAA